jgi:hypothetical protein
MKKTLLTLIVLLTLTLVLTSCEAPLTEVSLTTQDATQTSDPSAPETSATTPVETVYTADDLRNLISQYKAAGDHKGLYQTAIKLLELDPADTDAYLIAIDALANLNKANYAEINRLLALSGENARDLQAIAAWVKEYQPNVSLNMPFVPDYTSAEQINIAGISLGNMTNAAKYRSYDGWWAGGLLTWQGDWVYLVRPDEQFALYKMRADGSAYQRIGEENGSCLNVIGDWIYYINHHEKSSIYKIRTDGSMKTKISGDDSAFLSSEGEWLYYHSGNDGGSLCKIKTDGSGKEILVDATVMFPCVVDGYVYYSEKSQDSSLYRVSVDGGKPTIVVKSATQPYLYKDDKGNDTIFNLDTGFLATCCMWENWLYFFDANRPHSVRRVRPDGTGYEVVLPMDSYITTLNIVGNNLLISFWEQKAYEEDGYKTGQHIVTLDLETLEKLNHIEADTEPLCSGPNGWVYYFKHSEGQAWYAMSPDGKEHKIG